MDCGGPTSSTTSTSSCSASIGAEHATPRSIRCSVFASAQPLRWPQGFVCAGCAGRLVYQLTVRPRVFECAGCGQQHSVTAGTVFHRTRTPLRKWFATAWLIGQDKRGVSALFLARELALRYDTAWLMAHKLRHVLSERPEFPLDGLLEIDESYYGVAVSPKAGAAALLIRTKA
jgi:Transposase zinc-ribbon domain